MGSSFRYSLLKDWKGQGGMTLNLEIAGPLLKERREAKGLSFEDVSNSLKVRKSMVAALESADWTILPHAVYVKGYVREYARLLGVYDEVMVLLEEAKDKPAVNVQEPEPQPLPPPQAKVRGPVAFRWKPALFYTAVAAVVALFFVFDRSIRLHIPVGEIEKTTHTAVTSPNRTAEQQKTSEVPAAKKLMITCHERTWVSIVIDDQEKKEMMLNPQEILVLNGRERFDLLVGNAGGIKIFLNGKDTGFSGESREVKRASLS
jgi:cytoskeletal protein RodZ